MCEGIRTEFADEVDKSFRGREGSGDYWQMGSGLELSYISKATPTPTDKGDATMLEESSDRPAPQSQQNHLTERMPNVWSTVYGIAT